VEYKTQLSMNENQKYQLQKAIQLLNDAYSILDVIAKEVGEDYFSLENLKSSDDGRKIYCPSLSTPLVELDDVITSYQTISNYEKK
jgi:hypothetical protein